jgi:serine/threonine protein kinase
MHVCLKEGGIKPTVESVEMGRTRMNGTRVPNQRIFAEYNVCKDCITAVITPEHEVVKWLEDSGTAYRRVIWQMGSNLIEKVYKLDFKLERLLLANEINAYSELFDLQGTLLPFFYFATSNCPDYNIPVEENLTGIVVENVEDNSRFVTLARWKKTTPKRLSQHKNQRVLQNALKGLSQIHDRGVVHGAMSEENILVDLYTHCVVFKTFENSMFRRVMKRAVFDRLKLREKDRLRQLLIPTAV